MKRDLRLLMYEKELRRLLLELRDHDYVIFEDSRDDSRYVQYLVHDAGVLGEVGSRHWLPEAEGLRKVSVTALGCLGFEGGGLRRNFSRATFRTTRDGWRASPSSCLARPTASSRT